MNTLAIDEKLGSRFSGGMEGEPHYLTGHLPHVVTDESRERNARRLLEEIRAGADEPLDAWGAKGALKMLRLRCRLLRDTLEPAEHGKVMEIETLGAALYSSKPAVEAVRESLKGMIRERCERVRDGERSMVLEQVEQFDPHAGGQ